MRISDWSSDVCFRSSFAAPVVVDEGEAVQGRPDVALDDKQAWVAWLREDASGQSLWLARYAPDLSRELSRTQVAALQGRGRGTGFPQLVARNGEAFLVWTDLANGAPYLPGMQIGRATCRDSVCHSVSISVVAGTVKKTNTTNK